MDQVKNIYFPMTIRWLLLSAFTLVALACQNKSRENASEELPEDPTAEMTERTNASISLLPYVVVFNEESEQLEAEKETRFDQATLTVDGLTHALQINYPEIELQVDRVSNDTLFAQIPDARYLTQQMGSSGAQVYLMEATFAYTELPGIKVVHLEFTEGDHARPGNYTRMSFNEK